MSEGLSMTFDADYKGLARAYRGVAAGLIEEFRQLETEYMFRLLKTLRTYPRERAGQVYVRTFNFREAWGAEGPRMEGGDLVINIVNNIPYGQNVVGDNEGVGQNQKYHAGRWYLFHDVVEKAQVGFELDVDKIIIRRLTF